MANSDNTQAANSSADCLLTEEDILSFFLSKSDFEVRNSELVAHFRPALKTDQHRRANRQQFPQFINRLATVRLDDDGNKILTLKTKFRRDREDAAAATTTSDDVTDDVIGEAANGDRATAAAVAETADNGSRNHNEDGRTETSPAADTETVDSEQDHTTTTEKSANREEQATMKDSTPKSRDDNDSKVCTDKSNDSNGECLADDDQRTQREFKSVVSTSLDETEPEPATEESPAGDGDNHDAGPPGLANTTTTTNTTEAAEKLSLDSGTLYDNGRSVIEERQPPASEETVAEENVVDDGDRGVAYTKTSKAKNLSLEGKSYVTEERQPATEDTAVDDGPEIASATTRTTAKKTEKNLSLEEGKSRGADDTKSVTKDETANGGEASISTTTADVADNRSDDDRTKVETMPTPLVIVVEDPQPAPMEPSDEVDRPGGVRQLARRIDKAADSSRKTASTTATLRVKKQMSVRTQRPVSTSYDFTMNEQQREWTLRSSYSDYQALAKLLTRYQGIHLYKPSSKP